MRGVETKSGDIRKVRYEEVNIDQGQAVIAQELGE